MSARAFALWRELGTRVELAVPCRVDSRWRGRVSPVGGGCDGADRAGQGVAAGGGPGAQGQRAAALHGPHRRGARPRRAAPGGARAGLEPGDDPQGDARTAQRHDLRRCLPLPRRKPAEEHLPRLLDDIQAIVDGQSQADPKFQTTRLFTRISAAEVRRQLIASRATPTRSCPPSRRSTRSSTCWATAPTVAKCRPKKDRRDRRHLRGAERGQPRGRRADGHAADLDRRQGHGQGRPVLAPGAEPDRARRRTTTSSPRRR